PRRERRMMRRRQRRMELADRRTRPPLRYHRLRVGERRAAGVGGARTEPDTIEGHARRWWGQESREPDRLLFAADDHPYARDGFLPPADDDGPGHDRFLRAADDHRPGGFLFGGGHEDQRVEGETATAVESRLRGDGRRGRHGPVLLPRGAVARLGERHVFRRDLSWGDRGHRAARIP